MPSVYNVLDGVPNGTLSYGVFCLIKAVWLSLWEKTP